MSGTKATRNTDNILEMIDSAISANEKEKESGNTDSTFNGVYDSNQTSERSTESH